jgi:hypothetical protein
MGSDTEASGHRTGHLTGFNSPVPTSLSKKSRILPPVFGERTHSGFQNGGTRAAIQAVARVILARASPATQALG